MTRHLIIGLAALVGSAGSLLLGGYLVGVNVTDMAGGLLVIIGGFGMLAGFAGIMMGLSDL